MSDKAREKARALRYTRPIPEKLSYYDISAAVQDIAEECCDSLWMLENGDKILNALDGDEDELCEYKLMYAELSAVCDELAEQLAYIDMLDMSKRLDDFMVGIMRSCRQDAYGVAGYDSYEDDYFTLDAMEAKWAEEAAHKRLMRMTKAELIDAAGLCMGIVLPYLDLQGRYDRLKASCDILTGDAAELLKVIRDVDKAYTAAEKDGWGEKTTKKFERLLTGLPDIVWVN